jgi:hypothetical protein
MSAPAEHTVFDAANKNAMRTDFAVPVHIPVGKEAARQELARLMAEQKPAITVCKYRPPRGPRKYKKKELVAANDNVEPLPIVEALRRDKREEDIPLVMRYRTLVEVVGTSAYDDEVDMSAEGMNVEARSLKLGGKAFDKSFAKMTSTRLPGGEISYREQRHTVKQRVSVGQRTMAANDNSETRAQAPLRLMKSEDERIARIDGEPILAALRAGMGDLVHFFEDVVLGQWTLTQLGESLGYKHKARSREAKILVYTAIDRLREQWRLVDRQMAAAAAECNRRVEARRAELKAERAAYLGLAA